MPANRATFSTPAQLEDFVSQCDVLVHLAGMNRGEDEAVEKTNIELADALRAAMLRTSRKPHVLFSSSSHISGDSAYGRSKRRAAEILAHWAADSGGRFSNLILPHVFGESGRPFYNSVVSTFCYQLANDEEPEIKVDAELELFHTQDVARLIVDVIDNESAGDIRPTGFKMSVSDLLARLENLATTYAGGVIPDLDEPIDLALFNTYRSYLFPAAYPVSLQVRSDDRGSLFEAVKSQHGGQAFLSTTRPGITRGDHFHFAKVERFLVVSGSARIRIRRLYDDQVHEFPVDGDNPAYVDMPTLHTHNITNTGDGELLTLFWSHEIFDPDNPDTYAEPVTNGKTSQCKN